MRPSRRPRASPRSPQNSADAHGLLALCLIRAGWQPPYADEAKQSLALDPNNYWGLVASGRIADWDGHVEDARTLFRKASALHPEWPDAWGDLFLIDDDRGHVKEQIAVAQAYVKLNPQGHPHDENAEDAREIIAHASDFQAAFESDPPYQRPQEFPGKRGDYGEARQHDRGVYRRLCFVPRDD